MVPPHFRGPSLATIKAPYHVGRKVDNLAGVTEIVDSHSHHPSNRAHGYSRPPRRPVRAHEGAPPPSPNPAHVRVPKRHPQAHWQHGWVQKHPGRKTVASAPAQDRRRQATPRSAEASPGRRPASTSASVRTGATSARTGFRGKVRGGGNPRERTKRSHR